MARIGLAGYSLMRFTFGLLIAHTLGILVATAFAVVETESIVLSGPVLSATGGLIALISYRWDRSIGFLLGLAAPALSVTCLLLICLLRLNPDQAHAPVAGVLVLFSIGSVVACRAALRELSRGSEADRPTNPIQYSIAGLLLLMFAISSILSLGQTAGAKAATLGVFLAYVVVLLRVLDRFFANRRLRKLSQVGSFLESSPGSFEQPPRVLMGPAGGWRRSSGRLPLSYPAGAMAWLLVLQTAAILIAFICAVVEIQSIMAWGPILSLSGSLIAYFSFRKDCLLGFLYGLAAPTVAIFWFFMIVTSKWGPDEAYAPVSAFLGVSSLLCMPACALAVVELQTSGKMRPRPRFQFSIAALLVLMLVLAVVLGFSRDGGFEGVVRGISAGYLVLLLYVVVLFFRNRKQQRLAVAAPSSPGATSNA